jgi:hypothetical protein
VSFARYLHENRGQYIDHRTPPVTGLGVPIDEDAYGDVVVGRDGRRRRRRSARSGRANAMRSRYRHVQPAFPRSFWIDLLPYEGPEERARRFNS